VTGGCWSQKTEFEKLKKNRVTYPSIRNLMWIMTKYTFKGLRCDWWPLEPKNGI
jgi:hypothetical protein